MKSRRVVLFAGLTAGVIATFWLVGPAAAVDYTWGGGTGNWSEVNWLSGPVSGPTAGSDTATISSGYVTADASYQPPGGSGISVAAITVENGTLNLSTFNLINNTGAMTIGAGGLLTQTNVNGWNILNNLTMQGGTLQSVGTVGGAFGSYFLPGTVTVSGGAASYFTNSGGLFINLDLASNGGTTFNVADAASSLTASTALGNRWDGSASLTKTGAGTLVLSGNNTYTGGTTVSGGTLSVAGYNYLPGSGGITIASGAILLTDASDHNNTQTISSTITLSGGTLAAGSGIAADNGHGIYGNYYFIGGGAIHATGGVTFNHFSREYWRQR